MYYTNANNRGSCVRERQYMGTLYFLNNFSVNLKLLPKSLLIKKKLRVKISYMHSHFTSVESLW